MILKTAGYMWHRKYVDWSRRALKGVPESGGGIERDFADQSAIYGLYDAQHTCIYIGQAGKGDSSALFERLKAHALEDHLFCFWERFSWFGLYSAEQVGNKIFPDREIREFSIAESLNNLESMATYLALPRFNRRFGSGFGHVDWYYQKEEYEEQLRRGMVGTLPK